MNKITRRELIKQTGLGVGAFAAISLIGCSKPDSSSSESATAAPKMIRRKRWCDQNWSD